MQPSFNSPVPHGPSNVIGAEPAISPDSLIGASTPKLLASVKDTST